MLTGAQTYFGRTTELVQKARPKLHIEAVVAKLVRWLFVIVGSILSMVAILALTRGTPLIEMISLLLVLLLSAVPVALPVMFTVSMAVGAAELAKRGVLVTRLSAAEDAATMDVLCVDKTGTITMNQLAVTGLIPLGPSKDPMCYSPARWRRRRPIRIPLTKRSLPRLGSGIFSTAFPRSRRSHSSRSMRKPGGRRRWSSRVGSVFG